MQKSLKVAGFYVTEKEMELLKTFAEQTRRPINNFVKYAVFEYIERLAEKDHSKKNNFDILKKEIK